jgi:hypothetical protein
MGVPELTIKTMYIDGFEHGYGRLRGCPESDSGYNDYLRMPAQKRVRGYV